MLGQVNGVVVPALARDDGEVGAVVGHDRDQLRVARTARVLEHDGCPGVTAGPDHDVPVNGLAGAFEPQPDRLFGFGVGRDVDQERVVDRCGHGGRTVLRRQDAEGLGLC